MTTGEKIAKLRKENGLTQEELGQLLGVSRQAVSKWELEGAFPETEKLILLAKRFNCSIDYLLNFELDFVESKAKSKINKRKLVSSIFYVSFCVLMLLVYLLPFFKTDFIYLYANLYNIIFANNYKMVNYIILLHFICIVGLLAVSILSIFLEMKKGFKIVLILNISLLIINIFIDVFGVANNMNYGIITSGMIMMTLLQVISLCCLNVFKKKNMI